MSEMYVSPTGTRMRVASPDTAIRMRARGWRPESEAATPARQPKPKPAPKPDPESSSDES